MAKTRNRISFIKDNLLTVCTVIGVFGGVFLGIVLRSSQDERLEKSFDGKNPSSSVLFEYSNYNTLNTESIQRGLTMIFPSKDLSNLGIIWKPRHVMYVNFFGDLFLRMLKGLIIPLLVSSIVASVGSLDLSLSKKIGFRAIAWYLSTTFIAVAEGIVLVLLIQPGTSNITTTTAKPMRRNVLTVDTLLDLVRNMFPDNIVRATVSQYRTVLIQPKNQSDLALTDWEIGHEETAASNILGLVIFAIIMGIAIGRTGPLGQPLLKFFQSLSEVTMLMTTWVIWLSPVGVCFLVASKILEVESLSAIVGQLGLYFSTVMIGLCVHGLIVLPILFTIFTRLLPFRFLLNMSQAFVTAFGTGSSNATLPVSMSCVEEKNGVDPRVSRFVMPIGATINMDGTALYEAVAALFIAQIRNIPLSIGHIVAVSITATMASIGAAGIPQAGLVTMVMVLDTVGLPAEDVTLIIAVDWLLDRFRTTINVIGDSLGTGVVDHLSRGELEDQAESMRLDIIKPENHIDS